MKSNLGVKSARFISILVVSIVVITSLAIGGFSIWSEYTNVVNEIIKRYRLSISGYGNQLSNNIVENAEEIARSAAHGNDVVFTAVMLQGNSKTNKSEEEIIFCMGQADGGFNGLDTGDLAKLSERPEKLLRSSLRNEVFTRDLLKEIEFNNNKILPAFFTPVIFKIVNIHNIALENIIDIVGLLNAGIIVDA